MSEFPNLLVRPGSYPCLIRHPDGQRLAAELELGESRAPQGRVFDWPIHGQSGITFPQPAEKFPVLQCDLRAGWDVLLLDVTVVTRLPRQTDLRASLAVAGHGLNDPGVTFPEASDQVTEGHRLFAKAPLTQVTLPSPMPETGEVEFSVKVDCDASVTYSSGDNQLRCRYWINSLTDYRRFFVTTAPVFEIKNSVPLTPVQWMTRHVVSLRELVTLATLESQHLAWATLDEDCDDASIKGIPCSYQLYSQDIQQVPYAPPANLHNESRTLFTFPDLPYSPVDLLRRWEDLRATHAGFIRPLMQGLTEQMRPRMRFLFLVQALEGLHTETVGDGAVTLKQHRDGRKEVLKAVKDAGLDKDWVDRWLDRYGRYSLAERLTQLRDAVRLDVERVADVDRVPGEIPDIRNRLSHGAEDYSWQELRPAMEVMSAIGAAHVLRLLDLPLDRLPMVFGQR